MKIMKTLFAEIGWATFAGVGFVTRVAIALDTEGTWYALPRPQAERGLHGLRTSYDGIAGRNTSVSRADRRC